MKRSILFLFVVMMAFSGFARAEDIDDLSTPPVQDVSPTEYSSGQWAPTGEPITSEERLPPKVTQDEVKFQNFSFDTLNYVDPVAVVQQGKLGELNKRNVLILSLRRSKMVGNRANDLQVDFAFKGQLSKYVCVKKGRLVYRYCGNPIVAMIVDQPINLKIRSEYITQIQEICRTTMQQYGCQVIQPQQPQQVVCRPTYRRPGFAMKDTKASSSWVYEEGIVKLCISWLLNPPKVNNTNNVAGGAGGNATGGNSENTNNNGNVNNNTNPISVGVAN